MVTKQRIDQLLVDRGLAETRNRAQALVLAGEVYSGTQRLDKPGTRILVDAALEVRARSPRYASRAGGKLVAALDTFSVTVDGRVALDAGASTGGFVGVLLERGARRVYAVDVGYGQLDLKLREDPRVVVRDRVNVRHLTAEQVPEPIELVTLDLSFISLTKVLPALVPLVVDGGTFVCLVKPQFEVGRAQVGKGGIVRDEQARQSALTTVAECAIGLGLKQVGHLDSPVHGATGNVEMLLVLEKKS